MKTLLLVILAFISSITSGQTPKAATQSTSEQMQQLLKETAKHYRNSKYYNIARVQTRITDGEFTREWAKNYSRVVAASDNRYVREDKSDYFWEIRQSDGVDDWIWHPWTKQYVQRKVRKEDSGEKNPAASGWADWLMNIDKHLAEGRVDSLETTEIGGRQTRCMVIVGPPGRGRQDPLQQVQTKYWIDRDAKILVKEVLEVRSLIKEHKFKTAMTTLYTTVLLGEAANDIAFRFVPPINAERIERFDTEPIELVGKPAPALKLKTLDGNDFDMASLKGQAVIVDFWSSWCGACREAKPFLATLHSELKDKGLVIVSVSKDEEISDAAKYLARHNYDWIQLADSDWTTEKEWGSTGLPHLVLISPTGTVTFESIGFDEEEGNKLRAELHKLNPDFAKP